MTIHVPRPSFDAVAGVFIGFADRDPPIACELDWGGWRRIVIDPPRAAHLPCVFWLPAAATPSPLILRLRGAHEKLRYGGLIVVKASAGETIPPDERRY